MASSPAPEPPEEWNTQNYLMSNDRVLKEVPTPEWRRLPTNKLYKEDGVVDVQFLREHLKREGRLTEDAALRLLTDVRDLLHDEPNVLRLEAPLSVIGDLHGQFYDLLEILDTEELKRKHLFLGDYVDRGCFGTEICFLLFAMKLRDPASIWLLRGNHECRLLTGHFNFKRECLAKYSPDVCCSLSPQY